MHVLPIFILVFLGGSLILAAAWSPFSSKRDSKRVRAGKILASGLIILGAIGWTRASAYGRSRPADCR